ncbi:hypothetical protein LTR50_006405 [Elasticomyces elasticus]|nr:hypothetical protein LTR50_006405 [Elasticomyces elasticus]
MTGCALLRERNSQSYNGAPRGYTIPYTGFSKQILINANEEKKQHAQLMDQYNKQASDYIFRENNAVGRVDGDTIDLHGQFIEEAEEIVRQRIRYAQSTGQSHLHIIVGKGNHSPGHVQKVKPAVEQICQELGLQYATEENAGRIYVNLQGGPAIMPPHHGGHQQQQNQHNQPQYGQPHYQTAYPMGGQPQYGWNQQQSYPGQQQQQQQQQQHGNQQNQNQQQFDMENEVKKNLPKIFRLLRSCCTVM